MPAHEPVTSDASAPHSDHRSDARYEASALDAFATALLVAAGARDDIARDTASVLLDGDLMGHTTHGLALLPGYLQALCDGNMRRDGAPTTLASSPAAETWDGQRLPGPWLTLRALESARQMASTQGTGTVVVRRSHHIGCLASYAKRAAERGVMAIVCCIDPATHSVAPHGAITSVFTPNPLAAGIPTSRDPILLDISASYTTNGMTMRLHRKGEKLPHPWVQDAAGNPTSDPSVLFGEPRGTLLPLGGVEAGHKGYALALLIEAMTAGLAAHGRADPPEGWGASVFVQVLDPAAFGGHGPFGRQMDFLVDACHDATPRPGVERVRLPGERALRLYREQTTHGVALYHEVMPGLEPWAAKLRVDVPRPK